jgi:hypothetical protein
MKHISTIIDSIAGQNEDMHDEFYSLQQCTTCGHPVDMCTCGSALPTLAEQQADICHHDEDYDKPFTTTITPSQQK